VGLSASWIAIRGLDRQEVCRRLDAVDTRRPCDDLTTKLALAELANGWTIIRSRQFDFPNPKRLSNLSQGVEVIAGQIEEHVMVSLGRGFRDGSEIWSVTHDPGKGLGSLVVEGEAPPALASISERLQREQEAAGGDEAGVDLVFEAVPELVSELCGYRPDEGEPPKFVELLPNRRGLFGTLAGMFGRR
jgi:hypothetical protein